VRGAARQFAATPSCTHALDIIKRNSEPGPSEFVVAAASSAMSAQRGRQPNRQRDGFSQYGGNILAAFRAISRRRYLYRHQSQAYGEHVHG